MDEAHRRRAENELFFRSLNEEIEQIGADVFPSSDERGQRPYDFVCECHDKDCAERIAMTIPDYEGVRSDSRRFLVAPADRHVAPDVEEIVDKGSRYWVVAKIGEAAGLAEADDTRA